MGNINSIVVIGSGNVATNLAIAFNNIGVQILQVYSRNTTHAKLLADKVSATYTDNLADIKLNADLYIISINDDAIENIASSLKLSEKLVVHTSGSINMDVLKDISSNYGVFYPLQTFSKDTLIELIDVPFCIEANTIEAEAVLTNLAGTVSKDVRIINSDERKIIHLAAVFACNFSNYMYLIAESLLKEHTISFDILKPLILHTANKMNTLSPMLTQTGPAKRNDLKLIEKHISLLKETPDYLEIYKTISKSIVDKYHN